MAKSHLVMGPSAREAGGLEGVRRPSEKVQQQPWKSGKSDAETLSQIRQKRQYLFTHKKRPLDSKSANEAQLAFSQVRRRWVPSRADF